VLESAETTVLLQRWQAGDDQAERALWDQTYATLRDLARGVQAGPGAAGMESADLVDAAWEKLSRGVDKAILDSSHFKALVVRTMRQVVVEHVRRRGAAKREDAAKRHPLDDVVGALERSVGGLLDLNQALDELAEQDDALARVVEQHFFGGLSYAEIAAPLGVTTRTIERRMATARGWLHMRLKEKRA